MQFKKNILAAAVAGTVIAAAQPASAQIEIPANLSTAERAAWVGIESAASLVASVVAKKFSCGGSYGLSGTIYAVDPNDDGGDDSTIGGTLTVDERDIDIDVEVTDNQRGTNILVTTGGRETIGGEEIRGLRGDYWFSRDSAIMYGDAVFRINDDLWDEHIIKDFFVSTVQIGDEPATLGIRDEGIEVITKLDFPVAKWFQTSQYQRFNGIPGKFEVEKNRQQFFGGSTCVIRISGDLFNDFSGGGLAVSADITVSPF